MQNKKQRIIIFVTIIVIGFILVLFGRDQYFKNLHYELLKASAEGDVIRVGELIQKGVDINAKFGGDGETALHRAATQGRIDVMKLLIAKGANPNARDSDSATPLLGASYKGNAEAVSLLLSSGADVNIPESRYHMTPLLMAVFKGHIDVVKLLLANGADKNAVTIDNKTAEMIAAEGNNADMIDILRGRALPP